MASCPHWRWLALVAVAWSVCGLHVAAQASGGSMELALSQAAAAAGGGRCPTTPGVCQASANSSSLEASSSTWALRNDGYPGADRAAAAEGRCTDSGDFFARQQQWQRAVQAYHECSMRVNNTGQVAAGSMFRAFYVLFWELHDRPAAAAACKAGWDAHNTPELAWCAGFALTHMQQYSDAKQWAERAIALGCFSGSCRSLGPNVPAQMSWEAPWEVLRWALKGLHDAAGEAEAHRRQHQAQCAREQGGNSAAACAQQPAATSQQRATNAAAYLPKPRVAVGFVTAHRPALFQRTFNSFRQRCLDCNRLVESWVAVDDHSEADEIEEMQKTAPPSFVTWLNKTRELSGHVGSLNTLLKAVWDYDYVVHVEDDWLFTQDESFVAAAIDILQSDPAVGQVLFNQDYLESDTQEEIRLVEASTAVRTTASGRPYLLQQWVADMKSPRWQQHMQRLGPGKVSHRHWPHFSLRPGVWRMAAIRRLGLFDASATGHAEAEFLYAKRFVAAGFKAAFLPGVHCLHLSPTRSVKQGFAGLDASFDRMFDRHGLRGISVAKSQSVYVKKGVLVF